MRPERRGALLADPPPADEDQTGWLVTFSDLVLQLFAFVVVATVLGGTGLPGAALPAARPQPPIEAEQLAEPMSVEASWPHYGPAPAGEMSLASLDLPVEAPAACGATAPTVVDAEPAAADAGAIPDRAADAGPAAPRLDDPVVGELADDEAGLPPAAAAGEATAPPDPALAQLGNIAQRLQMAVAAQGHGDAVTVAMRPTGVMLSLNDTIGFPSGSAELEAAVRPILAEVRALLAGMPEFRVQVEGHTDDRPIRTVAFPSNLELSLARAARVARELGATDPTLRERIAAAGYGEQRPVAPNTEPDGRARNRRVEVWLVPAA